MSDELPTDAVQILQEACALHKCGCALQRVADYKAKELDFWANLHQVAAQILGLTSAQGEGVMDGWDSIAWGYRIFRNNYYPSQMFPALLPDGDKLRPEYDAGFRVGVDLAREFAEKAAW